VRAESGDPRFSVALREATRPEHRTAESTPFAAALATGRLSRAALGALTVQYHAIYSALEQVGDWMSGDPVATPFLDRRLDRVPALAADATALCGPQWARRVPLVEPARAYRDRILAVCAGRAGRYVAHHYVRYLGDLSGGQIVRRALERAGVATGADGASFYTFPQIEDAGAYKRRYRSLLDALPGTADDRREFVAEARRGFALTTEVFRALAGYLAGDPRPDVARPGG
jgi:heme oxygenase